VLRERGGALETAGLLDELAPSEDIRAVRFAGDRGYIVTFKKTDPLFVIDLADAEHPRVRAELKIPGFSTYIHRLGQDHLLTVGYDAADQGDFAWFTGVLLQIFDVTDASAPRLVHRESIGTRGSSSEALTNHLAFTYFAPRKLLLLPMTVCEGGDTNGGYGTLPSFSGLMAWEASADGGFSSLGGVSHPAGDGVTCGNWWTQGSSQVRRSILLEDYVLSLSDTQLKVNRLGSLSQDLVTVPLVD
jgi:hypothetical protein